MTKFGTVMQVVEKHVSKGSVTPTKLGGAEPHRPQNFWNLIHVCTQHDKQSTTLYMAIKLRVRKISTGATMSPTLAKIFMTRMLTTELFAVANLLVMPRP